MVSKPGSGQQDLLEKGDEGFENSRGLSGGVQLGEGEGWSGGVDRSITSEIDAISCSAVCLWESGHCGVNGERIKGNHTWGNKRTHLRSWVCVQSFPKW